MYFLVILATLSHHFKWVKHLPYSILFKYTCTVVVVLLFVCMIFINIVKHIG